MSGFAWIVKDAAGNATETTETFATKEEAEAWMGAEWSSLRDRGGDAVTLVSDDETLYEMSLHEA